MSFALRFIASFVVATVYSIATLGLNTWTTIVSGGLAGSQFADSDSAAIQNSVGQGFLASSGFLPEGVTSFLKSMVSKP